MGISKEGLKSMIGKARIIDVRSKEETESGVIPSARHIPLDELEQALEMDPVEFEQEYGFDKPKKQDVVIFYCYSGARSEIASRIASSLGFNAKNYPGSIIEWSQSEPLMSL